jgi:5-methylcytosine-specific restriction endonuclease McrA
MRYVDYILSPAWRAMRNWRLAEDKFTCRGCGRKHELQVHHLSYERLGHEDIDDLITLCVRCHNDADFADQRSEITDEMALQATPVTEAEWLAHRPPE